MFATGSSCCHGIVELSHPSNVCVDTDTVLKLLTHISVQSGSWPISVAGMSRSLTCALQYQLCLKSSNADKLWIDQIWGTSWFLSRRCLFIRHISDSTAGILQIYGGRQWVIGPDGSMKMALHLAKVGLLQAHACRP